MSETWLLISSISFSNYLGWEDSVSLLIQSLASLFDSSHSFLALELSLSASSLGNTPAKFQLNLRHTYFPMDWTMQPTFSEEEWILEILTTGPEETSETTA